jgi:hypothetical protein
MSEHKSIVCRDCKYLAKKWFGLRWLCGFPACLHRVTGKPYQSCSKIRVGKGIRINNKKAICYGDPSLTLCQGEN